jgi:alpha-ribazole phosphatase
MDRFIDLLRHGEPEGGGRFRGGSEGPLSPVGLAQMQATVAGAGDGGGDGRPPWDLVVTSPARRCSAFAEALALGRGLPLESWPALGERDWGDWEGCSADQIPAEDLSRFWADPVGFTPPGAEHFAMFHQRVLGAWDALRTHRARHPLVVTHGGALRAILGAVLNMPPAALIFIEVPYACHTRLRLPQIGRPSLMAHGPCRGSP